MSIYIYIIMVISSFMLLAWAIMAFAENNKNWWIIFVIQMVLTGYTLILWSAVGVK